MIDPATAGIISAAADDANGMTHSNAAEYIANALIYETDMDASAAFIMADDFLCNQARGA